MTRRFSFVRVGFIAALAVSAVTAVGTASAGSKSQVERCSKYRLIDSGTYTWEQAAADARSRGGVLASISSLEEQICVDATGGGNSAWISGTDAASEGDWRWAFARKNGQFWLGDYDGRATGFANWGGGEPNNSGDEDCAEIDLGGGQWNDSNCGEYKYYILRLP
ncbi:MAG: C-type lectin domain-containing protein [Ilumatobacteraceae bacterium]